METRWIKRISFILAAAMLLTLLPVSALAEEASPSRNAPAPIIDTPADTPAEEHVVALTAADGGRVSGGGVYVDGEEVTVTAHPSEDYDFTGWYQDEQLVSLDPVYSFKAMGAVAYQANFTSTASSYTLTVKGPAKLSETAGTLDSDGQISLAPNTPVTLTYTGAEGTFLYWVNNSGNILSTDKDYTFTMVRDTTIEAKYTESAPTVSRVVFRNGYAQIMGDFTNGEVPSLPDGPTKMGYTFDYWYYVKGNKEVTLNKESLEAFVAGLDDDPTTRIDVLPRYSENGAQYTINISYQNADGDALETQPDPKTQTVKVGVKTNTGAAPETIGDLTFSYWKDGDSGKEVSYDRNYSVLRAQSCTVNLVAVYVDPIEKSTPEPIANIIQTYASKSGEKYVVSNTLQYYLPEGYELVQAGIEYYTSNPEKVRRSIDSNTTRRGLFTFNARLSNPATTLNAKGFIIYKNEAGEVQEPQYSDWVSKSYYDLSGTASVKQNEQGNTVTVAPATIQAPVASEANTPEVTAIIPEGVMLEQKPGENTAAAPVSLSVVVVKEPVPESVDIPSVAQQTTNFQVSIEGVDPDNTTPIVVCLSQALQTGLTGVKAYHDGAEMTAAGSSDLKIADTFYYDKESGDLYICVIHFSDFTFTYKSNVIKFPNVDKYLYRVGNNGDVALSTIFNADSISDVTVTTVVGATGTYNSNDQTIDFNGTGVVRLTATLTNGDTITLPLEVVEATNATSAVNATTQNVCLLKDIPIGNQTIHVSNGYSFYGNGFTVTTRSNGEYLNSGGMSTGYFEVIGGTMDNVQLDCAIYPSAFLYSTSGTEYVEQTNNKTRTEQTTNGTKNYYGFQYSAVVVSGGGVISNCYIKGARNNILATGSATVSNTTCDRGSLSNIFLTGSDTSTVTLEDVTTIQYISSDDFGKDKKVEGVGVLVGHPEKNAENPNLVIRGELNQYNWVSSEDANSVTSSQVAKSIISSALNQSTYIHTSNTKNYVNMGVLFLNTKQPHISDERSGHGYVQSDITISVGLASISGQVYAPANNAGTVEIKNSGYEYDGSDNNAYVPLYTVHSLSTTQPSEDTYCWNDNGTIRIQYLKGTTSTFDVAQYVSFGRYSDEATTYTVECGNAESINGSVITFESSSAGESEIVITVSGSKSYTPGGEETTSQPYVIRIPVDIHVKKNIPSAVITVDNTNLTNKFYRSSDYYPETPVLQGITIKDYDSSGNEYYVLNAAADNQSSFISIIRDISSSEYDKDNDATTVTITLVNGTVLKIKHGGVYKQATGKGGEPRYKQYNNVFYIHGTGAYASKNVTDDSTGSLTVKSYSYTGENGVTVSYDVSRTFTSKIKSNLLNGSTQDISLKKSVIFDLQGGELPDGTNSYSTTTVILPTPTKEGYVFQNWNTNADGSGTAKTAGTSYNVTANTTLYAIWAKPFTATFVSYGETVATVAGGANTSQNAPAADRTFEWLEGWYTAEDGGTKIGNGGASFTMPSADTTYYAHWSPKYFVTYNANGGTVSTTDANTTYAGTALTLPTPTNGSKTFEGWYTAAEGGTKIGAEGDSYAPTANITLYAHWSDNIKVTFNGNGGTAGTNSGTYDHVTPITLPTATRAGHQFNGWYTAASGGTKIGDGDASYTPTEPTTLYAQWTAYTVSFDGNGATNPNALSAGSNGSVTLPTPTRTGYTLNGWYTAASGGTKVGNGGASYTPTADITLHAQWTVNSYKVTITTSNSSTAVTVNGTTVNSGGSVAYNSVVKVVLSYTQSNSKTFTIKQGSTNVTRYSNEACTTISNSNDAGTYYFKMPAGDVTINSSSTCLPSGTLITLADGTQKPIEDVTMDDAVLAFNHETGAFEPASIIFIENDGEAQYNVVNLAFSDGTVTRLIYEHGYFDLDLMQYVYITEDNCADFVGHRFAKTALGDTGYEFEPVTLTDAYVTRETTGCYSFPTVYHLNVIADGMLSMPGGIEGMFNIFTYDEDLKYDADAMAMDIETYGLLTYDDFADVMSYEEYALYPAPYLAVSMGKGLMTSEQLSYLIERYVAAKR